MCLSKLFSSVLEQKVMQQKEIIKSVNWKDLTGDIAHSVSSRKNNLFD